MNMHFTSVQIDKDIPLPPSRSRLDGSTWALFKVGDSSFFPGGDQRELSSRAGSYGRQCHPQRKFATRSVTENGVKGIRVWRIE